MEPGNEKMAYPPPAAAPPPAYGYNQQPVFNQPPPAGMPVTQQPMQSSTTVVINQQPQVGVMLKRPWQESLCGCFDDFGTCLLVTFFGECYICWLASDMEESCCVGFCLGATGGTMALRIKLRSEQRIQGDIMNDCLVTACCTPCAMCQLAREHNHVKKAQTTMAVMAQPTVVTTTNAM